MREPDPGPLTDAIAAIPSRTQQAGSTPDLPGTFRTDALTVLTVPRNSAQPIATTYWLSDRRRDGHSTRLMSVDGSSGVGDCPRSSITLVALAFGYFRRPRNRR